MTNQECIMDVYDALTILKFALDPRVQNSDQQSSEIAFSVIANYVADQQIKKFRTPSNNEG